MNSIIEVVRSAIPSKHKVAAKSWISFNAPCCHHNRESRDTRGRGGFVFGADDSVVYHCFNCHFKTGWRPGMHFGVKMQKLLSWLGVDDSVIYRCIIDALKNVDREIVIAERKKIEHVFEPRELPPDTVSLSNIKEPKDDAADAIEYLKSRGYNLDDFNWMWSPDPGYCRRVIVPYTWKNKIVGYTARSIDFTSGKGKYIQHVGSDYVFGMDQQDNYAQFAILAEGVFDSICLGGLAVLTNEISMQKADLIDSLGREIIVVPDFDQAGKYMVDAALEYNWSVAFPDWESDIKDISDAYKRYGKLYTLQSIIKNKHNNKLKIQLLRKRYGV